MAKKDENGIPQSIPRGIVRIVKSETQNIAKQVARKVRGK